MGLFTIAIQGGGHLSYVHNIHIEICTRIIFVQVNFQQLVAASDVVSLQGTLHVQAFVSPSAFQSQQLRIVKRIVENRNRQKQRKRNLTMILTHLSPFVKTVSTFAVSVKIWPLVLTYLNFRPTSSFSIPLYAKQSYKTRGLQNALGWKRKGNNLLSLLVQHHFR